MTPQAFLKLSLVLTGERTLDGARAERLRERLIAASDPQLLERLDEIAGRLPVGSEDRDALVASEVMTSEALRGVALRIVVLWYTGDLFGARNGARGSEPTPEDYFAGLLWPAISAHPPALSGGYFGHWTYPPDN